MYDVRTGFRIRDVAQAAFPVPESPEGTTTVAYDDLQGYLKTRSKVQLQRQAVTLRSLDPAIHQPSNRSPRLPAILLANTTSGYLNTLAATIHYHVPRTKIELYIDETRSVNISRLAYFDFLIDARSTIRSHHPPTVPGSFFEFIRPGHPGQLRLFSSPASNITWKSLDLVIWGYLFYLYEQPYQRYLHPVEIKIEMVGMNEGTCSLRW